MYREKANLEEDADALAEDFKIANRWVEKALETKKAGNHPDGSVEGSPSGEFTPPGPAVFVLPSGSVEL